ncbi:hypothetical protein N431DRAFT_330525 [Stipitochalara longipes BDJ]|nr:hypothetical protein N431DRAFT_330525 [Stipitochalara longipes BDJ]
MPEKMEAVVKHRACDECRTRKLACSKDPDGCERCKRENIVCHYSEQKPMGRPRKRQFIESVTGDVDPAQANAFDLGSIPFGDGDFDPFLDGIIAEPYYTNGLSALTLPLESTMPGPMSTANGRNGAWNFGNRDIMGIPPINFGSVDATTPPLDPAPQLSTDSNNSDSSGNSPPQSIGGPGCSCLASMYLSLASLQEFPSDVIAALRTVRSACATAAASIWCQKCGGPVLLDNPNPPIEAFQNVMLLGTILPIIANGYQRLLQMVDDETAKAEALGQTKTFRFFDYGGMCGRQVISNEVACAETTRLASPVEMPPQQWRTTVRALLRVDIYGHEQPGFKHKGLKDLVAEMENRQRTRHEMLDAHVAALGEDAFKEGPLSALKGRGLTGHGHMKCTEGGSTHGCLQILQIAKLSIDNLTIA